ncbi:MAG TPA: outer membrane protein assembly factor BamA [Pseudolabrys sp.]|nr:outer membrane protein assembly factor BamA [Pseudolabrys sp.]
MSVRLQAAGLSGLFLLCAGAILPAPARAQAGDSDQASIIVSGNRHVDPAAIKAHVRLSKDSAAFGEDVDATLKALYATHLFSDVKVWRSGSSLHIQVVENPTIDAIAFEGNKAIKDKELRSLVTSKEKGPLSSALVHDDIALMTTVYRRRGRFDAKITPKTIAHGDHRASLVYEIAEGPRTGITKIEFKGNGAYGRSKLKGIIKTGETNLLSFLLDNDFYDPEKVENDRKLLLQFYRAHGYPDVQVTSAEPRYEPEKKVLVLTFTISEGMRHRFGDVAVTSNVKGIDAKSLDRLLETRTGDVYDADAIERTVDTLLARLARRGEPFAAVKPETRRVDGKQIVDLVYRIENGPRLYVERIDVHGNAKTRENVIRRELTFGEGSPYNKALVHASERHLKKLGFFKNVTITRKDGSAPDRVVLDLKVEEQETGQFTIAGGYSDVDGAVANVTLGERNAFGSGRGVVVSLDYGQYVKGFNVGYTEPYLFGQKVALGLNLFARQSDANSNQSYTSTSYGGKIGFGLPLTDEMGLNLHYALANQSLQLDPALGKASIPIQQAAAAGSQWVSTVGATATYNTLDDDRHPSKGILARANNDIAGFGGDVKFYRNTNDLKYYQPLNEYLTSMSRVQSGYVVPWGGQELPLLNGFFGGPQLVRGFAPNGFGPRDITSGTTMDNIGGTVYWATSQEIQAPLPMVPPEFGLKGAVFADAGSLWGRGSASYGPALAQSLQVSNSRAIRSSIGVGLVWDSILGPLRVDYAYPLTKGPYDVTQRLHFGFGLF